MKCMLYTHKSELTTMGKSLIYNKRCWRQWLVEPRSHGISVMENMSGVHTDITFSTVKGTWSTVTTPDSSWIAPTLLADACCFLVPQRCSPDGVSLPSTSLRRDFVVCSSLRKLGEDLLRFQEEMPHHLRDRSVSAGDLAENTLLK